MAKLFHDATKQEKFVLQEGETMVDTFRPHPLVLGPKLMLWLGILIISSLWGLVAQREIPILPQAWVRLFLQQVDQLIVGLKMSPWFGVLTSAQLQFYGVAISWCAIMLFFGLVVALLRFKLIWFWFSIGVVLAAILAGLWAGNPLTLPLTGGAIAWFVIVGMVLYVGNYSYVITSQRLVMRTALFGEKYRILQFKRLGDVLIMQDFWGRRFGFATLIPISLLWAEESAYLPSAEAQSEDFLKHSHRDYELIGVSDFERIHAELEQIIAQHDEAAQTEVRQANLKRTKFLGQVEETGD